VDLEGILGYDWLCHCPKGLKIYSLYLIGICHPTGGFSCQPFIRQHLTEELMLTILYFSFRLLA
jgi:hypothetical protein